jgi:endo-1,4-beta-xylanase
MFSSRKILYGSVLILTALLFAAGCDNSTNPTTGSFVPATDITGVPTGGTAGGEVDLGAATVVPDTATNQTIVWTVKNAGATGVTNAAVAGGKFTPANAGTLVLTATIADGTAQGADYAKDFTIAIAPADTFVAVTNITGVPMGGTAGSEINLAVATVVPDNADNQIIVWTVKSAGATGVTTAGIVNGKFTPANPGTLTLTATIAGGSAADTAFVKDFTIAIAPADAFVPVTNITGVPTGGTAGSEIDLGVAEVVPDNADNKTIVWTVKAADTTGVTNAAVSGGKFTPASAGALVLTATIANGSAEGTAFAKDFAITIFPADVFVPVTNITGVPTGADTETEVDLGVATVVPDNADHKTIVWTVKDAGGTGLTTAGIVNNKFTVTAPGTLKLTATIAGGTAQGTDYTQEFEIPIAPIYTYVAVTDIVGVPSEGTVDMPVSLAGAGVVPGNATYQEIVWRVKTAGAGVTAITGSSFTPTLIGTLVLEAVIASGAAEDLPYIKPFTFEIKTFVPATDINGVPAARNAVTGAALNLNSGVTVVPPGATNKAVTWSVKDAGSTGLTNAMVASGSFTPAAAGTATLTATVLNGAAQGEHITKDTVITIIKPVTDITGVPSNGTRDFPVSLAGALVEPGDATNKTIVWSVKTAGAGVTTISGSSFTPTATGTLELTATIANGSGVGTAYTKDFSITIYDPGSTNSDFGLGDDTSITLRGNLGGADQGVLSAAVAVTIPKDASYYVSVVSGSSYDDPVWYLNGTKQTVTGSLIFLDTSAARTFKLYVEAKKGAALESSKTYTFTISEQ